MKRHFTAPYSGPLTLDVSARALVLEVEVSDRCDVATIELSGPAEVVEGAEVGAFGEVWALRLPARSTGQGATTIVSHGNRATTVVQSFGTVTGSVTGMVIDGDLNMVGGRVYVNGVEVTSAGQRSQEPTIARVRLPAASSLNTAITGVVEVLGELLAIIHQSMSADLNVAAVRNARVTTVSGDIRVGQAKAAGFQVTRTSWRRRTYRHPRVDAALAARATTPTTTTPKPSTTRPSAPVDRSERAA